MKGLILLIICVTLFHYSNNQALPVITQQANSADTSEVVSQISNEEADTILIKNTYLIGRAGGAEDVLVNILIINGNLVVVTKDNVPSGTKIIALDAEKGFLMGNLVLGASPSFVILSENPRENQDVVLNSAAYIRFAMREGKIIQNELPRLLPSTEEVELKQDSWSSYNPPPIAVPLNYYDSRKWNKFETSIISGLFTGILALDRLRWVSQDDASSNQVGDLAESSIGAIRAMRFGLVGTFNFESPWVYTVFLANSSFDKSYDPDASSGLILYDARLDIPMPLQMNLSIGKQKEPISLERLTILLFTPWQERSAPADAFIPPRNWGIVLNGTMFENRTSWAAGVFNNWIDAHQSIESTSTQFTGRFTGIPYVTADESNLLHLGLGVRFSDAKQEVRGRTEAEFFQSPTFVDTDFFPADNTFTYNIEAFWRKAQYSLGFEYAGVNVNATDYGDPKFYGCNISGSWIITGEMKKYIRKNGLFGPVPVAESVDQGGWGAWEVAIRYSTIDLTEGTLEGGKMDTYSLALNWWLSRYTQFSLNYRYIILDRFDGEGASSGLNIRLAVMLE